MRFGGGYFPGPERRFTGFDGSMTDYPVTFTARQMCVMEWTYQTLQLSASGIIHVIGVGDFPFGPLLGIHTPDPYAANWFDLVRGGHWPNIRSWSITCSADIVIGLPVIFGGGTGICTIIATVTMADLLWIPGAPILYTKALRLSLSALYNDIAGGGGAMTANLRTYTAGGGAGPFPVLGQWVAIGNSVDYAFIPSFADGYMTLDFTDLAFTILATLPPP